MAGAPASLVERLPTWLKTAKNRAEILRDGRHRLEGEGVGGPRTGSMIFSMTLRVPGMNGSIRIIAS
ncbi:hypothetical protein ACWEPN_35820 [Nonomuraea wenchangensis]